MNPYGLALAVFLATFVPLQIKVRRDAASRGSWDPEQRRRAKRWWNRLDYLWVSLAALGVFEGLLTASHSQTQFEKELRERYVESSRSIAQQIARTLGSSLTRLASDGRLATDARNDYQVGIDYYERAVIALAEAVATQEWRRFAADGPEAAELRQHRFATDAGSVVLADLDLLTRHVEELNSFEQLRSARQAAKDPAAWQAIRGLFPILLAAALGIRLTIVSARVNELA